MKFWIVSFLGLLTYSTAIAETRLMMVEELGCHWCEQWHQEVGDAYPKTDEGKAAPLLIYELGDELPDGIVLRSLPHYTPTFILLVNGREVNRIEGYPGEDFFWSILNKMLADIS